MVTYILSLASVHALDNLGEDLYLVLIEFGVPVKQGLSHLLLLLLPLLLLLLHIILEHD